MKRIFFFFLVAVVLCLNVFAVDELGVVTPAPSSVEEINNSDTWEITNIETYSVSPVTPSDVSGLKAVLLQFLGSYDPVIVEFEYRDPGSSYDRYLREVQPDYVWMASFILLCLFVYCLFRIGGALLG